MVVRFNPQYDTFEFDYKGTDLIYGRGSIDKLEKWLDNYNFGRAMVVTGSNVGENSEVMDPVTAGLGDRSRDIFDETTPQKLAETVYGGINVMEKVQPDVLVGVGGGSSLDLARQISVFAADGRPLSEFREAAYEQRLSPPDPCEPLTPVILIPTTFAGADISNSGSVEILSADESPAGEAVRSHGYISPEAIFYDPNLYDTTPFAALTGSAMNGFNKGIETIYARSAMPVTDATAVLGLQLLKEALPKLPGNRRAMEQAVIGIILVQFEQQVSIIHAFGHGFSRQYDLQQGIIHAIIVPHVLRYLFNNVPARREIIADALGIETKAISDDEVASLIIKEIEEIRNALDLPTRLKDLAQIREEDLPAIAQLISDNKGMRRLPEAFDPTVEEIGKVLRCAW